MEQPLVSFIIPVYNGEKWLADCLQSVVDQSVPDLEIIVIDDASTDGTPQIVRSFADRDPRIKILVNERNSGHAAARNRGLDMSTGRWIATPDCDDTIEPDFCKILLAEAERSGADIIKGRSRILETDGSAHETPRQWHEDIMSKSPLCFNDDWWSAIYRADKIRGKVRLHDEAPIAVDLLFLSEAISLPLKVACVDDIVYTQVVRANSVGAYRNRPLKKIEACIDATASILQTLNERKVYATDPYGYRVWAREALRRLGGFHRARKEERETALAICAARAPQVASLIRCEYPGIKKFLMPLVLKILSDDRLMPARLLLFRSYDIMKRIRPLKGH
ncbi:MAG: glycosyltransferase family 2 protein [Desulfovibrio sp.]|uniref:glycosyltransferase n=1 Tax=Desulfovibrio sp. TaxID=885 RepID=UPI001A6574E0|nr:glycosyltransferase family 2 protein [Desulfovibrio sp.]MBD5416907.1 glycosyltransferase family 2 protein [Desulfovibrio sp.]